MFTRARGGRWFFWVLGLSFVGLWVSSTTAWANTCVHVAPTAAHTKVLKYWLQVARQHNTSADTQRHACTLGHALFTSCAWVMLISCWGVTVKLGCCFANAQMYIQDRRKQTRTQIHKCTHTRHDRLYNRQMWRGKKEDSFMHFSPCSEKLHCILMLFFPQCWIYLKIFSIFTAVGVLLHSCLHD